MAFSVSRSRPFRSLGLYKYTGKHAAPKRPVHAPRTESDTEHGPDVIDTAITETCAAEGRAAENGLAEAAENGLSESNGTQKRAA